jgi:uracil-DNA glycosylase family 4
LKKNRKKFLKGISQKISKCTRCDLHLNRKNTVPGEGNFNAKVMIIGQAPGKLEDELGRPFVGKSGQLLDEILIEIGIKRNNIFITSVNKCFPPNNRAPKLSEIRSCMPYLNEQIRVIEPNIIILLGNVAVKGVLELNKPLRDIKGKFISKNGIIYFSTYHPAAVLRNMKIKADFKKDLEKIFSKEV